jgi:hypothetical protein
MHRGEHATPLRARTTAPHFGTNGIGDASTEDPLRRWRNVRTNLGGCVGVKCSAHSTPGAKTSRIESKAGASVSKRRRLCTRRACSSESGQGERRCQEKADHAFESERQECGPQQPGGQAGNPHAAGKAARLAHSVNHRRCKSQSECQSDEKSPAMIRQYLCPEQRRPESKRHRQ